MISHLKSFCVSISVVYEKIQRINKIHYPKLTKIREFGGLTQDAAP